MERNLCRVLGLTDLFFTRSLKIKELWPSLTHFWRERTSTDYFVIPFVRLSVQQDNWLAKCLFVITFVRLSVLKAIGSLSAFLLFLLYICLSDKTIGSLSAFLLFLLYICLSDKTIGSLSAFLLFRLYASLSDKTISSLSAFLGTLFQKEYLILRSWSCTYVYCYWLGCCFDTIMGTSISLMIRSELMPWLPNCRACPVAFRWLFSVFCLSWRLS